MSSTVHTSALASPALWNDTVCMTYLFDAFSVMLTPGEAFFSEAVEAAAQGLPEDSLLRPAVQEFVAEERAHQRAHRLYNQRLADQGYDVHTLSQRVESDLKNFTERWGVDERLCLTAALEHITSVLSQAALSRAGWLSAKESPQTQLWRWHCTEELAHAHVAFDLLQARGISAWKRWAFFLLASWWVTTDLWRQMLRFHHVDRTREPARARAFWPSVLGFLCRGSLWRGVAGNWARYFLPLSRLSGSAAERAPMKDRVEVRFLLASDIDALRELEGKKWEPGQAASREDMLERIQRYPELSLGAFSARTGEALASLFMKPSAEHLLMQSANWHECVNSVPDDASGAEPVLFGISFSSVRPHAADALFEFFWPYALKSGWRHIYLGSPIPGYRRWEAKHPGASVYRYVHSRCLANSSRRIVPRDAQLRYYHQRGFRQIMCIRPSYFPHEASHNHGVLLRGTVPLSKAAPLWRWVPMSCLHAIKKSLFLLL